MISRLHFWLRHTLTGDEACDRQNEAVSIQFRSPSAGLIAWY